MMQFKTPQFEKKAQTVSVLMGGWSAERDVSLTSGQACVTALKKSGYTVKAIDVTQDLGQLLTDLKDSPDVIFNALHGLWGEDGCIQSVLDILGLTYTHSGRLASAIAMNKTHSKNLVHAAGVQVPEGHVLETFNADTQQCPIAPPFVIKPNEEGSSVGVHIIRAQDNRLNDILSRWTHGTLLVEKYIQGRELTVAVLDEQPLTVTEITSNTGFYDYEAKYAPGGSVHILPANIPKDVFETAKKWALIAHKALGCKGATRTDFRYDDTKPGIEGLFYLETNTQPGMTSTSLVPEQAAHFGMSFEDLVSWMVETAYQGPL